MSKLVSCTVKVSLRFFVILFQKRVAGAADDMKEEAAETEAVPGNLSMQSLCG